MPPRGSRDRQEDVDADAAPASKRQRLVVRLNRSGGMDRDAADDDDASDVQEAGSTRLVAGATAVADAEANARGGGGSGPGDADDAPDLAEPEFRSDGDASDEDGDGGLTIAVGRGRQSSKASRSNNARAHQGQSSRGRQDEAEDSTGDEPDEALTPRDGHEGGGGDFSLLPLKKDHASRPLWINPHNRHIILEGFSPIAEQAMDFLVAIAEPVSRPAHIHEYQLTMYSLFAAVSVGLQPTDILEVLNRLSKSPIPQSIVSFVLDNTKSFGKVKLVLKQNRYYIESAHPDVLRMLLRDEVIGKARITEAERNQQQQNGNSRLEVLGRAAAPSRGNLIIPGTGGARQAGQGASGAGRNMNIREAPGDKTTASKAATNAAAASGNVAAAGGTLNDADLFSSIIGMDDEGDGLGALGGNEDEEDMVHSFEVREEATEEVRRRCNDIGYPMLEEYDFRNDHSNPDLEIDLKPVTQIRPYQEKSLSKMFGNGRARSGIIVLPCGAGKTLVGITAACTIKKSCLVLATSSVSVMQWKREFMQWSNIQDHQISVFTADQKEKFTSAAGIVVSTYSMVANTGKRSHSSQKMMNFLESREWGFILLDEVHVVPASMFRRVLTKIKAHSKLGLTATLVREDEKIDELNFLVGPKLYEANWMDLAAKGHIATVQCAEVWCPMTPEFYREYLREKSRKRMLLYCMNPNKFQACQFLINYHENRGDKIIVFSDNVYALEAYAKKLNKLFIHGGIPQTERMRVLQHFQHNPTINTIFLSKVGDTSIDLPEATCLIQISSHFGSRRQEAQRLGRILRAKRRSEDGFNAFFYSLVSTDTSEMYYSSRRQAFLVSQGYAYRCITKLTGLQEMEDLILRTREEQIELLQSVLIANDSAADVGKDMAGASGWEEEAHGGGGASSSGNRRIGAAPASFKAKRSTGSLDALSGAGTMSYVERNKSANRTLAKDKHAIFKNRYKK